MSLGNLHDPRAAAKMIADFRAKFSTKTCIAPMKDHAGSIVSAHTMSREAVLRPISVNGHVYAPSFKLNPSKTEPTPPLEKLGLREVSVFNGFCAHHDAALFSCIENHSFRFEPEQLFKLAYRAAARDCYMKRKQCESMPPLEDMRAIHGVKGHLEYSDEMLVFQACSLRGAEEFEALKKQLDDYLVHDSWSRLVTKAIFFPKTPSITACFGFQPYYDMNGAKLQEYEDMTAEMSYLFLSLIPLERGGCGNIFVA